MTWKCPNCWSEYEINAKFEQALKDKKDCKFCARKDPNIPTVAEMDGLLSKEDMRNRFTVVFQCISCKKWTTHTDWKKHRTGYNPCSSCGDINYDTTSIKSLRCYNPLVDNKRTPKKKK